MGYEIILFDADDTLFDYPRAEEHALSSVFRHIGIEESQARAEETDSYTFRYKQINGGLWKELEQGHVTTSELKVERFRRLFEGDAAVTINADEISDRYLGFLGEGHFLFDGAEAVIRNLAKHFRLAIITNGYKDVQLSRIARSGLADCFEQVIISEEAGYQKPHTGIFDYAFEKLGHHDRSKMLIVGDSLTSDMQGGLNIGIDTCWYNPAGKPNGTDVKPKYEIRSLDELYGIVEPHTEV
ncbi:YjjG family noncanonical pyrimidine nucleotidase [Paenibacillus gorillae]|uniref:YjjG family noncanonical pyrimidine nucleotidase n=1 Tax=Paenibacillus gorillae TaxID=1243662 RepID=UPI0004B70881|nr:YjjG family noncanonical pyrimidine nucleotidase [Paenibacillus gorillae]